MMTQKEFAENAAARGPYIQKPTIRSSSLPLFMECSNAVLNPDDLQVVETENEPAVAGNLVHGVLRTLVETGELTLETLRERLDDEGYDRAVLQVNNFHKLWKEASVYMTAPQTEWAFKVELGSVLITGHIDIHHMDPARAFVLDYKTGRQHEDHYHQMAAYAYGVWDKAGRPHGFTVYVTAVYLEDNSVHPYEFTSAALQQWAEEVQNQVYNVRYTVGRKCAGCALQDSCPAYAGFGLNAVRIFREETAIPQQSWEEMTPDQRGELVDKMYVVEKAIDRAKLGLRNLVKSKGSVDVGKGKEYVLVEQQQKHIDPVKAARIFSLRLPGSERLAKFSLEDVLSYAASRAPKGKKMQARKELFEELEKAGAINRSTSVKMWRRPIGEKVLNTEEK